MLVQVAKRFRLRAKTPPPGPTPLFGPLPDSRRPPPPPAAAAARRPPLLPAAAARRRPPPAAATTAPALLPARPLQCEAARMRVHSHFEAH